jgi:hypothetical protein
MFMVSVVLKYRYILLHVGNLEETLLWKAEDRCLGSNNSSVVILTEVSTVITKGSLSGNDRIYKRGTAFERQSGSLKFETVKYGHEYQGTRTREKLRWQQ